MKSVIEGYLKQGEAIKDAWLLYVVDQSVPLDTRWESFLAAPSDWHDDRTSSRAPLDAVQGILDSPYDDFHMELESSMSVTELFDDLEDRINDPDVDDFDQTVYDAAREEAMKINLGRWTYDQ
jgi:hypothetical protein